MKKIFDNLDKESAVEIRSKLDGFEESAGYEVFKAYFNGRVRELRDKTLPIMNNDFATLSAFNRRLYLAEAFDEVLRWSQDAKVQCDAVVGGER